MLSSILSDIPQLSGIPLAEITTQKLSGLTNQNYLITTPNEKFILRIPKQSTNKYINRIDESINSTIANELDISPKTIWNNKKGLSLTQYIKNSRELKSRDLQNPDIQNKLQKILSILQSSNKPFNSKLTTNKIIEHLKSYYGACSFKSQRALNADYQKAIQILKNQNNQRALVPSHIDLVPENMLLQGDTLWIIDWEYSAMASPFWDLATICNSGNIDINASCKLLKNTLEDYTEQDNETLRNYQQIVKSIGDCWLKAFTEE